MIGLRPKRNPTRASLFAPQTYTQLYDFPKPYSLLSLVGPTTTLISENSSPSSNHSPSRPAFSVVR
ncbi:hypothetical protein Hdeb2414_s0007g00248641 [Helianthus debilis subsp. tardiflorus]